MTQVGGTKREQRNSRRRDAERNPRVPHHRVALDALALVNLVRAIDRVFDQAANQHRRPVAGTLRRFHGAEDGGIKRRLVLFQVEHHLFVGHLARQRPREEPRAGGHQHEAGGNAEPEDGRGSELEGFERVGNGQDSHDAGNQEADRAAQRQLEAPSPAYLPDHFEQLRARIELTHLRHLRGRAALHGRPSSRHLTAWRATVAGPAPFPRSAAGYLRTADTTRPVGPVPGPCPVRRPGLRLSRRCRCP